MAKKPAVETAFYTPLEVARILGKSKTSIYHFIYAGGLPSIKLPDGTFRIPIDEFRTWVQAKRLTQPELLLQVKTAPRRPTFLQRRGKTRKEA